MTVENSTIIIAIATAIAYLIGYRKSKLLGSLSILGIGVLTLFYSSGTTDPKAYGILGWIIIGVSIILILDYLISPQKKKRG